MTSSIPFWEVPTHVLCMDGQLMECTFKCNKSNVYWSSVDRVSHFSVDYSRPTSFWTGLVWNAPSPTMSFELLVETRTTNWTQKIDKSKMLLSLVLWHCCPLKELESFSTICPSFMWFRLGIHKSMWLDEIIYHRWLFEHMLVQLVHQVALIKLSLNPTWRRLGKPTHLIVSAFQLGMAWTILDFDNLLSMYG